MRIKLDDYLYIPALRSRAAELTGLKNLDDEVKKGILPLITLGKWPKAEDIQSSLEKAKDAMGGHPFILDVTREATHHNESSKRLLDPSKSFERWQKFVEPYEFVVPVVQITEDAKVRDIVSQARFFEQEKGQLAFRLTNLEADIEKMVPALATLDAPEHALIIVDVGYIRNALPIATSAAIRAVNRIREEISEALIAVISTSFPQSVTSFTSDTNGRRGNIDIQERELFGNIGGTEVCIYGDHGSIHSVVYPDSMGRYVPRIDLPLDDAWYFERRPDTGSEGYVDAAKAILTRHPWVQDRSEWGAEMIRQAAAGQIEGMGSPAKWIAVRVNLHIARQLALSKSIAEIESGEDLI